MQMQILDYVISFVCKGLFKVVALPLSFGKKEQICWLFIYLFILTIDFELKRTGELALFLVKNPKEVLFISTTVL